MSEYQYYEFLALDCALSPAEMSELRDISSRAQISPNRFCNVYNYGDLRAEPMEMMKDYFDIMVYITNWGTHQLMLRLPKQAIDHKALTAYCGGDMVNLYPADDNIILDFNIYQEEYYDWEEGEGQITAFIPLRQELLQNDFRAAYLAWLASAQFGEVDEDTEEPPLPPGLQNLSPALHALAEFLWLDRDLLLAAAAASPALSSYDDTGLAEWLASLDIKRKDQLLQQLLTEPRTATRLSAQLLNEFRQIKPEKQAGSQTPRTFGELMDARSHMRAARLAQERKQAERERARRAAEAAAAKERRLDDLAPQRVQAWQQVEDLIHLKQAKPYDQAAQLVDDLHALSVRDGHKAEFQAKLQALYETHRPKRAFWQRIEKLGLV